MNTEIVQTLEPVKGGWNFRGYKKGGSGSAPFEMPDTKASTSYAKILVALSEGEIVGPVNGLKSIYLDGTPIQNEDGSLNFYNVKVDFRSGTQYQEPIAGFPAAEAAESVNVQLRANQPWVKAFSDTEISAVRININFPKLQSINAKGEILGWWVDLAIDIATDNGPYVEVSRVSMADKLTDYTRSVRVDLPRAQSGWLVRVRRLTADSTSSTLSTDTYIREITKIYDARLRYPNMALLGIQIDASQFGSIPTVSVDCKGIIRSIPSNYDPDTHTYNGTWDGTLKRGYTNNPAWVFYDYLVNGRYGLRKHIEPEMIDKVALYRIGQYCDEMVDDGKGGKEPRFTCNAYNQTSADAYRFLTDIASIFRGMVYWGAGIAVPVADMPGSSLYTYTNASVVNGAFTYAGVPRKTQFTSALVSWNDPSDHYRQKVESYCYREGVLRPGLGMNETKVTSFGCTSRAQARRLAKWTVLTSCLEDQTVTFAVGLDGVIPTPGRIIKVADQDRAGRRIGGRIRSATKTEIEIDSDLVIHPGDYITCNLPNGIAEKREVKTSDYAYLSADSTEITADSTEITADMTGWPESVTKVTVVKPFTLAPQAQAVWALESEELSAQAFKVLSVTENSDGTYTISGIKHIESKYDAIDHESILDDPPITVVPPKVQPAPANVTISNNSVVDAGIERINATIAWEKAEFAQYYEISWRRDNSNWVSLPRSSNTSVDIADVFAGSYEARVRAFNALGSASLWAASEVTELNGTLGEPPAVTHLKTTSLTFGIQLDWGFPEQLAVIDNTEIWYSNTPSLNDAVKLVNLAYPQHRQQILGLAAGKRLYFWARLVGKNGTLGAFYPQGNGVLGTSSVDADEILEYLKDQITETQLAQALLKKIEASEGAAISVEQITTDLAAMYNIKCQYTQDGVPYMAGIGVGVENNDGIITSQILLAAERVAILDESSGELVTPFVVQGGQVFINDAIIGKLSAKHIQVNQLSELTTDAGILVAGKLQGTNTNSYIDLNAQGNNFVANWGNGAMTVTANGVLTINQANVINTLQIANEAVGTKVSHVNAAAYSIDPVCSNYEYEAYTQNLNTVVANNITAGATVTVTPEIVARITSKQNEGPVYAAVCILRNGAEIQRIPLPFGFWSVTATLSGGTAALGDSVQWVIPLSGSSFAVDDAPGVMAQVSYTAQLLLWHSSRHARVNLDMYRSALHVEVKRK